MRPGRQDGWSLGAALRLGLFLLLASFIVVQPTVRQGLGLETPKWVRSWQMFVGSSTDICDVRYSVVDPDGGLSRVDPVATMGYDSRRQAPRSLWRMGSASEIERWGRRLCAELGPDAELRVESRCASRAGWKPVHDGSVDLCRLPPSPRDAARDEPEVPSLDEDDTP